MPDVDVGEGCLYDGTPSVPTFTEDELAAISELADEEIKAARSGRRFPIVTSILSENYGPRPMRAPFGIVLHHTGGRFAGDLRALTKPHSGAGGKSVSANDYITKKGVIYQLCPFPRRAWHAGACREVNGITDWNTHGWGIEIENLGKANDPYPAVQIDAVVWRCRERRRALGINNPAMLTRHRDVSKEGKPDTSDSFPYAEVRKRVFAKTDSTDSTKPPPSGSVTTDKANLRAAGDESGRILAVVSAGSPVKILAGGAGDWRRVQLIGFVHASLLQQTGTDEITVKTPLLGKPRAKVAQAQKFILDREHGYTNDQVRRIVQYYFEVGKSVGLDPVICIAQMVLETATLTSELARSYHNFAGIGATGAPNAPIVKFRDWQEGVRGHVGRVCAYAIAKGKENDAQATLIKEALAKRKLDDKLRGVASDIDGLKAWAADPQYRVKIAALADNMRKAGR
jgi:N-acetyl-anhydromuramyl-L-alanine amidase AmpD